MFGFFDKNSLHMFKFAVFTRLSGDKSNRGGFMKSLLTTLSLEKKQDTSTAAAPTKDT
jgi:hypothetical protein